jgi:adenylate cyclase
VLFADVSGSTRLYEKLGDKEALHAVERCINRMTRATEQFKGRVIKTIGDEVMAVFDSAEAGMDAACSMQQRVDDLPPVRGIKLAIRVGFHFGPAIEEAKDVFGDTVNTAARMAGLAKAGQIITTAEHGECPAGAAAAVDARDRRPVGEGQGGGRARLRGALAGVGRPHHEVRQRRAGSCRRAHDVRHGGARRRRSIAGHGVFSLGRDAASDIIINDRRASRTHARIERRRDKFVLIDQSTNGTYVTFDGEAEFALKREEVILRSKGRISFGHAHDDGGEVVEFQVG